MNNGRDTPGNDARDDIDVSLRRRAAGFLDAQTSAIDAPTRAALAAARAQATQPQRRLWLQFGSAGFGVALAASLTALVIMPRIGSDAIEAPIAAVAVVPESSPEMATATATATPAAVSAVVAHDAARDKTASATGNGFAEIALVDETEAALADELAFVAWLEENHDQS